MSVKGFTRAGHFPMLIALLYFDVTFMTWAMLISGRIIRRRRGTRGVNLGLGP